MLPFRSGRPILAGASAVIFLLLAVLSCVTLAGEKNAKPQTELKPKPKARPKPEEGMPNIPIVAGHDAKGLVLPEYDLKGHLRGKLEAGITKRLDDDRVEFKEVKYTTFTPETEAPDLEIVVNSSVFNLKTQILTSSERATVKRADFEISGDAMQFEMLTRKGTLTGNVKMIVRGNARAPRNQDE